MRWLTEKQEHKKNSLMNKWVKKQKQLTVKEEEYKDLNNAYYELVANYDSMRQLTPKQASLIIKELGDVLEHGVTARERKAAKLDAGAAEANYNQFKKEVIESQAKEITIDYHSDMTDEQIVKAIRTKQEQK